MTASLPIRTCFMGLALISAMVSAFAAAPSTMDPEQDYLARYAKKKFAPLLLALTRENLSPAVVNATETLLIDRELKLALAKRNTGKQGKELIEHLQQLRAETATTLRRDLGPALAAHVEDYIRTLPQRQLVHDINQVLAYENVSLTAPQIDALCALIASQEPFPPEEATRIDRSLLAARKRAAYAVVTLKAASFLQPRQLKAVEDELALQVAFLATNLGR